MIFIHLHILKCVLLQQLQTTGCAFSWLRDFAATAGSAAGWLMEFWAAFHCWAEEGRPAVKHVHYTVGVGGSTIVGRGPPDMQVSVLQAARPD